MYSDYGWVQKYEEDLQAKASEFRSAQADAAWVMMGLGRGVKVVGHWLLWWGKKLQLAAAHKRAGVARSVLLAQRNS
ncbi:MAG: hypothetical protein DYG89_17130 [Caldilinea sp. CFX5]|nr:hypothetical protein [Caldilinea sp. CFX5]